MIEEKLSAAFSVVATSHDVSLQCHRYAISSLCFYSFPLCEEGFAEQKPRKVKRKHSFNYLLQLHLLYWLDLS